MGLSIWEGKKAQELLATRSQRNARTGSTFLFTSLIYCKECGGRVKASRVKGIAYYSCYNHDAFGSQRCANTKHLPEHRIESFLLENLEDAAKSYNAAILQKQKPPKDEAKIRRKLEKLKDLYLDDLISREVYERDYRALEAELSAYVPTETPVDLDAVRSAANIYSTLPMPQKKAFWSRTIRRIEINSAGQIFLTL